MTQGDATLERALHYLSFEVSGQHCGLLLPEVQEIVEHHAVTRVPAAPRFVLGVFNLRGNVVPVVDLASYLGLERRAASRRSCLIVLRERKGEQTSLIALLCDAVHNVLDLAPSEIQPPPSVGTRIAPELLTGVAALSERLLHLLAIDGLLALDDEPSGKHGSDLDWGEADA